MSLPLQVMQTRAPRFCALLGSMGTTGCGWRPKLHPMGQGRHPHRPWQYLANVVLTQAAAPQLVLPRVATSGAIWVALGDRVGDVGVRLLPHSWGNFSALRMAWQIQLTQQLCACVGQRCVDDLRQGGTTTSSCAGHGGAPRRSQTADPTLNPASLKVSGTAKVVDKFQNAR